MSDATQSRQDRQADLDRRIAALREKATSMETESERLRGQVNTDGAFWTQPAYGNSGGRSMAGRRNRERNKLIRSGELALAAKAMRDRADAMERAGVRMAGDANAEKVAKIDASDIQVGQIVRTLYGDRRVVKVNAKSVLIDGACGPIRVEKHLVKVVS